MPESLQLCDCNPPGSSVHGILQTKILDWIVMPSSRGSSGHRDQTLGQAPHIPAGRFFSTSTAWEACVFTVEGVKYYRFLYTVLKVRGYLSKILFSSVQFNSVTQSCLTLCDPMNHSSPGLPVHHQLPEFTQTHAHRVGDAIQPSHPLPSPSPPAPNPS